MKPELFRQSGTQYKLSKVLQLQQKKLLCKQLHQAFKKLVLVLPTSAPVTKVNNEDVIILDWVSYICYLIWFKKSKVQVQALLDFGSEVNAITLEYILKLGLKICPINIKAQNIDGFILKTFGIVLASFQVENKLEKSRFFHETYLLADLSIKMVLEMSFLTLSNANIQFA